MRFMFSAISIFCLFCISGVWTDDDPRATEKKILEELLNSTRYDPHFRPYGQNKTHPWGGPVKLKVQLYVRQIREIDDNREEFQVQLTVRQKWNDDRLTYDDPTGSIKYIRLSQAHRIWAPDLFVANDIEAEHLAFLVPNQLMRIYPNGNVLYSTRVSLRLACRMDFRTFPFDGQKCFIRMPSYGYTSENVLVSWEKADPVQIAKNVHPVRFHLEKFSTGYCDSRTSTGEYSCISVGFLFKRLYGYYQIQVYIPCAMLVIISWLTFWLDPKNVTARVTVALITLLTMAVQISNFNSTVPAVSYTKALDVWTGICLTFSFGALVEFFVVHFLSRRKRQHKANESANNIPLNDMGENGKVDQVEKPPATMKTTPSSKRFCCDIWSLISTPEGLDLVSRMIYPLVFILFNIIYWTAYAFAFTAIENEFDAEFVDNSRHHSGHSGGGHSGGVQSDVGYHHLGHMG